MIRPVSDLPRGFPSFHVCNLCSSYALTIRNGDVRCRGGSKSRRDPPTIDVRLNPRPRLYAPVQRFHSCSILLYNLSYASYLFELSLKLFDLLQYLLETFYRRICVINEISCTVVLLPGCVLCLRVQLGESQLHEIMFHDVVTGGALMQTYSLPPLLDRIHQPIKVA